MKKEFIAIVFAFLLPISLTLYKLNFSEKEVSRIAASDELKVLSFNTHMGFHNGGFANPVPFLNYIRKLNPDIIAIQESESNRLISGNYNQVRFLAKKLGMFFYYGPQTKEQIYGVSILSKYPLFGKKIHYLPSVEDQRVVVEASFLFKRKRVRILNFHSGLAPVDRYRQYKTIWDKLIKDNKTSTIFLGDFNQEPYFDFTNPKPPPSWDDKWKKHRQKEFERDIRRMKPYHLSEKAKSDDFKGILSFREVYTDTWFALNFYHGQNFSCFDNRELYGDPVDQIRHPEMIDYIFVSKDFEVLSAEVHNDDETLLLSDHIPITARIAFKTKR